MNGNSRPYLGVVDLGTHRVAVGVIVFGLINSLKYLRLKNLTSSLLDRQTERNSLLWLSATGHLGHVGELNLYVLPKSYFDP